VLGDRHSLTQFGNSAAAILECMLSSCSDADILQEALYHVVQPTVTRDVPHVASPLLSLYLICVSLRTI
jgi:hypothetical protein